jgi:hypothetical protein
MKHESIIEISDAGDSEEACVESLTEVGKLCKVPSGYNALKLMAFFEVIQSHHHGTARDECGWSGWLVLQSVLVHMKIKRIWPMGGTDTKITRIERYDYYPRVNQTFATFEQWNYSDWDPGETVNTNLVDFPGPYNPGDYLAIWFGLEIGNAVLVNDYYLYTSLRQEHRVDGVSVYFYKR